MRSKLLWASLLTAFSSAPVAPSGSNLFPRCGGPFQLCGYVEKDSEAQRIPRRFEVANAFDEGLAPVRIEGLYGFIDTTGRIVIAPRFQAAGPFTGGYAEVRFDDASGVIDRSGRMIVPARFHRIIPFAGGTFIARPLRHGSPPTVSHSDRLEGLSKLASLYELNPAGLYHASKGWLTDANLTFSFFDDPARGLIWAGRRNEHNDEQWGMLRSDGKWQVSPRYNHVQWLVETHAVVGAMPDYSKPPRERRSAMLRGAVDRDGKLTVPLKFANVSYWRGGYGLVSEGKSVISNGSIIEPRKAILLADGTLLGDRYFDEVDIREDGKLPRGRIGKTWYSIERDGRRVPDQLDGRTLVECPGGLKIVERGEMVEFVSPGDGKPAGKFDDGYFSKRDCPGPFSAKRRAKWFFVLENGSVLGGPNGFDSNYSFSGNHAAVQVGGQWGIIDRSGAFTVKPRFAKLRPVSKDTFAVGEGEAMFWIDAKGKRVEKPIYNRPAPHQALTCAGGLRFFSVKGLWGLQDGQGNTVIEPLFRALSCFHQGVSWTAATGANDWCPIGPDGRRRDAIECRKTYYPVTVTHHSPEEFSKDRYESSVLWNRAWLEYQAGNRDEPPKWISEGRGSYSVMLGQASDR